MMIHVAVHERAPCLARETAEHRMYSHRGRRARGARTGRADREAGQSPPSTPRLPGQQLRRGRRSLGKRQAIDDELLHRRIAEQRHVLRRGRELARRHAERVGQSAPPSAARSSVPTARRCPASAAARGPEGHRDPERSRPISYVQRFRLSQTDAAPRARTCARRRAPASPSAAPPSGSSRRARTPRRRGRRTCRRLRSTDRCARRPRPARR